MVQEDPDADIGLFPSLEFDAQEIRNRSRRVRTKLQALEDRIIEKLERELDNGSLSAYNTAVSLVGMHNTLLKAESLRVALLKLCVG
jgi:hypothetical protein